MIKQNFLEFIDRNEPIIVCVKRLKRVVNIEERSLVQSLSDAFDDRLSLEQRVEELLNRLSSLKAKQL